MNIARTVFTFALLALLGVAAAPSCAGPDAGERDTSTTSPALSGEVRSVKLPLPRFEGPLSLEQAIEARRSVREFTDGPLSLDELGQLLWAAQGITSAQGARAAPSAGGTYPLEISVAVGRVSGLEPGVYRYRPTGHELALIASGDSRARLAEASLNQSSVSDAAADVVIAAVYSRTTEKYGERGVRYVHLEAGHAAQNLCLQATALGLGAVTVGAFSDSEVSSVMHLADDEQPLYVVPVGRPATP